LTRWPLSVAVRPIGAVFWYLVIDDVPITSSAANDGPWGELQHPAHRHIDDEPVESGDDHTGDHSDRGGEGDDLV